MPPLSRPHRFRTLVAAHAAIAIGLVGGAVAVPAVASAAARPLARPVTTTPGVRVPSWRPQFAQQPNGGVLLDSHGGLHPFGGVVLATNGAPSWPNDFARGLAVLSDGSGGWVLDAYGGIHAFGYAASVTPSATWPGNDVARALAMLPDGQSGYVLDRSGGLHPFGPNATAFAVTPAWPGQDIARGLSMDLDGTGAPIGGWIMDYTGATHAFGAAPALPQQHVFVNDDLWNQLHVTAAGGWLVGHFGIVETVGTAGGVNWSGAPDYGSDDVVRDIVPVNPAGPPAAKWVSGLSASAVMSRLQEWDRAVRGIPAVTEDNTLDGIAGGWVTYNLADCGGPSQLLPGRSMDMLARNYFSHVIQGCSGTQYVFSTYLTEMLGGTWHTAGENIAWLSGVASFADEAYQINTMWLNSPPHFANIVGTSYTHVGCGVAYSATGPYQGAGGPVYVWTCEFEG